jgi:hypothetical protein
MLRWTARAATPARSSRSSSTAWRRGQDHRLLTTAAQFVGAVDARLGLCAGRAERAARRHDADRDARFRRRTRLTAERGWPRTSQRCSSTAWHAPSSRSPRPPASSRPCAARAWWMPARRASSTCCRASPTSCARARCAHRDRIRRRRAAQALPPAATLLTPKPPAHRWCTECLVSDAALDTARLREALAGLGSSLVIAGRQGTRARSTSTPTTRKPCSASRPASARSTATRRTTCMRNKPRASRRARSRSSPTAPPTCPRN